ncbi:F-box/kelch-repeat protein At1g22040-like [Durio zibethinus]|uniref:F-box/kelch-repeat protein At1g22040-like n=1 Tax=Durio zibethinus TaxID=66656 RepID=A0A6P6AFT8_DURZI|nr:F-box/kelch-repeat protein At1g22040-like [Durio zibethinus]XP_022763739.1 F-box/kelch-repeat protein At1g22040-like [Durio zibethinus]XP_022763740.1 F-box/kelch-repeat protein At1g22040-like [Durio zibethinus]XP_022763741.1 F-box/kelch-repeat protein At1g22040-like [Durio zibethinus]
MGAFLSLNNSSAPTSDPLEVSQSEACKRQKLSSCLCEENQRLIPSLPDEMSYQILARIPRINYLNVRLVSRAWKAAIMSTELFNIRKELGKSEEWLYILTKVEGDKLLWYGLDPLSRRWQRLPPMPNVAFEGETRKGLTSLWMWNAMGSSIKIADVIRGWLGRKDALDRMSFCGCAVGAVDGCLYVLGGFSRASAMSCVWQYNPVLNSWSEVSPMSTGRAYCKTGILNNKLFVVGGVTRGRGGLTPLQSAEVFDPHSGIWSQIPSMPFSKAQVLPTAFLADLLKPIATGMTSYRGRLFVPQSLYCWPFFVDVGGEVYDPELNSWVEMPVGMGEGWPARQAGTKLSVTVDGELYALDPSSSLESAKIKVYNYQDDAWKVVVGEVPIPDFTDSETPYLLAGLLGKLHVVTKDANNNISVQQTDVQNHFTSLPSASSSSSDESSGVHAESAESATVIKTDLWTDIATRTVRSSELVSCQTLNI